MCMKNLNNITNVQNEKICAYSFVECHIRITFKGVFNCHCDRLQNKQILSEQKGKFSVKLSGYHKSNQPRNSEKFLVLKEHTFVTRRKLRIFIVITLSTFC